jgi:magnesium chelatase subunit I
MKRLFPFSAIVGQEQMKTALLLTAVDPTIGGVLIRGHKGTGKSTTARALAQVMPKIKVVKDCAYNCPPENEAEMHTCCLGRIQRGEELREEMRGVPFTELPLNATADRVVGTLHLEQTLKTGERHFEPGLLASAHRGVLYVDEVNLLEDHLVDMLLDVSASGLNRVEREGISYSHPARFILLGTMNPEEGELRPQFLDRFGLCVAVKGLDNKEERREVVQRALAFERDPDSFSRNWEKEDALLTQQIHTARCSLSFVKIPDEIWDLTIQIATKAKVHGHRADITIIKAAAALAALMERKEVTKSDIFQAAYFVLPHRLKVSVLLSEDKIKQEIEKLLIEVAAGEKQVKEKETGKRIDELQMDYTEHEKMQVPGAAAAGSILLTFLKKKARKGPLSRIN